MDAPSSRGSLSEGDEVFDSAAPSTTAKVLATLSILIGGTCGGLIGYAVTDLQCDDGCATLAAGMAVVGAAMGAIGVAVVAVLTLRAMAEWKAIEERDRRREARASGQ